jgi:hypothetical protein
MSDQKLQNKKAVPGPDTPWYRQFWPWFIIALPASAVIAGFFTLWLAISRPDHLVVDDEEYRRLNSELKAQLPVEEKRADTTGKPESKTD